MRLARTIVGGLAIALAVGGDIGGASAQGIGGTGAGGGSHRVTAGGMYGQLAGDPAPKTRRASAGSGSAAGAAQSEGVRDYHSEGTTCSLYANTGGMGSYCSSGDGVYEPLVKRFPELDFDNCRYDDPPPGVEVPANPNPRRQRWQLRTCLTGIDWLSYDGGDHRRFAIELVLVDQDFDTTYRKTPLSEFLWSSAQTTYPVPMLQVQPRHVPVVGQAAYFNFDWMNGETREPVDRGPYAEQHNRGMVMRAHAAKLTIDPQIEGVRPFDCSVADLGYEERQGPQAQRSDCRHVFTRSSAAAEQLSTAKHQEPGDYDEFQLKIDVRWDVEYGSRQHGFQPLGSYHMIVFQDLPVMDTEAVNVPLPEGDVG